MRLREAYKKYMEEMRAKRAREKGYIFECPFCFKRIEVNMALPEDDSPAKMARRIDQEEEEEMELPEVVEPESSCASSDD